MFDAFVFKKLAHNDTGAAAGHQGGIVVPKDISDFFPQLPNTTSALQPTVDKTLTAQLFVDGIHVATVETRYQHQTWGGTRPAERRLTGNLGPLRNVASADDILLFTKDVEDDSLVQLHLLRKGSTEFARVNLLAGARRRGILDTSNPPVSLQQLSAEESYIGQVALKPAFAFDVSRPTVQLTTTRLARDRAFRSRVLDEYGRRCAFTGQGFTSPLSTHVVGLDAAHIIPVEATGSDHPANGILLSKDMHWAFDRGLIGVAADRSILVPAAVRALPGNKFLSDLHGAKISEAKTPALRALEVSLKWHRENVLGK
jgi:putative restriction endonuclease